MPLSLSIAANDRLVTSFSLQGKTSPEIISSVTASVVNNQNVYTVVVPSGTYSCSPCNTTVLEKTLVGINTYVLGA
jgi:hypothetical protein